MRKIVHTTVVLAGAMLALPGLADGVPEIPHAAPSASAARTAHGVGVIKAIDRRHGTITLDHQPIKALDWPAMVMDFKVADARLLAGRSPGEKVAFELKGGALAPVVTALQPSR